MLASRLPTIAASTAQKTKNYDMYLRFVRWATDRLERKRHRSFICNRSFIDGRHTDVSVKLSVAER